MQQIADAAEVAVQTVFNHASSKEALFFLGRVPFTESLPRPGPCTSTDAWAETLVAHLAAVTIGYLRSLADPPRLAMAAQIEATPLLKRYERTILTEAEHQLAETIAEQLPDVDARLAAALLLATTRATAYAHRQLLLAGVAPEPSLDQLTVTLSRRLRAALDVARADPGPDPTGPALVASRLASWTGADHRQP